MRVSLLQNYKNWGLDNSLFWESILCVIGYLTASRTSPLTTRMPGAFSLVVATKMSTDMAKYLPGTNSTPVKNHWQKETDYVKVYN